MQDNNSPRKTGRGSPGLRVQRAASTGALRDDTRAAIAAYDHLVHLVIGGHLPSRPRGSRGRGGVIIVIGRRP